jgi:hypothetical protein
MLFIDEDQVRFLEDMISPFVDRNEASLLHVFDVNRVRIQEAASVAYSRRRQNYHRLSASDLLEPVHRRRKHGQR